MSQVNLTNVVNISVSAAQAGVGNYNTSNLAIFTHDAHEDSFGDLGYKIYLDPVEVGTDFGTSSNTYKEALAVFSQKPNILAGNGYLVVIPLLDDQPAVIAQQLISFSSVPTVGNYKLSYGVNTTGNIAYNATAADVQTALRLLAGLSTVTVSGNTTSGFTVVFTGVSGPATLLVVTNDSLQNTSGFDVFVSPATTVIGIAADGPEPLANGITRASSLVQFFGIISTVVEDSDAMLDAAAVVQAMNKIVWFVQRTQADIESGGSLDLLRTGGFDQSRGLYYGTGDPIDALVFMASYAGRALSTNFSGSNTTQNMHLKDMIGVQPDLTVSQTILNLAQAAGADCYPSLQGVPKIFASGANKFFDQVYNLLWFIGALQVAGFNALAQTSTKVPQTEEGVDVLTGAYRKVCESAKTNQYVAPGTWNNPTTFGNQDDFFRNISERGYYIYNAPVALQNQTDREARKAPLIQIAIKEAGAIDSSDVIVYVNA